MRCQASALRVRSNRGAGAALTRRSLFPASSAHVLRGGLTGRHSAVKPGLVNLLLLPSLLTEAQGSQDRCQADDGDGGEECHLRGPLGSVPRNIAIVAVRLRAIRAVGLMPTAVGEMFGGPLSDVRNLVRHSRKTNVASMSVGYPVCPKFGLSDPKGWARQTRNRPSPRRGRLLFTRCSAGDIAQRLVETVRRVTDS